MNWLAIVVVLYGLLNIGGGIDGFVTKHSIPSIISGGVSGIILIAMAIYSGKNPKVAYIVSAVVCLATLGFFAKNYFTKGPQVWPALVMMIASAIVLACLIVGHFMGGQKA